MDYCKLLNCSSLYSTLDVVGCMKRKIIVSGRTIELEFLGVDINKAFYSLYSAFLGSASYNWEDFQQSAFEYFNNSSTGPHQHGLFFNNFTPLCNLFLSSGQISQVEVIWDKVTQIALDWESQSGKRIHKGTPYYFWGMAAILKSDLDRGYALNHKALEEDMYFSGHLQPDQPALAWATLNADKTEQAFLSWVTAKSEILKHHLQNFCQHYSQSLTFSQVNTSFLQCHAVINSVFMLSYVLARIKKMREAPKQVFDGKFSSQLHLNLLFDLALVIDGAIHYHNPTQWKFLDHADFLVQQTGLSLNRQDLKDVNNSCRQNLDQTVPDLLDGHFQTSRRMSISGLERDVAITYALRNKGGHSQEPSTSIQTRAIEVYQGVFNTLFLAIKSLYAP